MDDLGNALAGNEALHMLGGGNPSHIPRVEAVIRERMIKILQNNHEFEWTVGNCDPPQGATEFIKALAALLRREYGRDVHAKNIALTNGSQIA